MEKILPMEQTQHRVPNDQYASFKALTLKSCKSTENHLHPNSVNYGWPDNSFSTVKKLIYEFWVPNAHSESMWAKSKIPVPIKISFLSRPTTSIENDCTGFKFWLVRD